MSSPTPEELCQHLAWVRALAGSLCSDAADADDVTQETWLQTLRQPPRDRSNLRAYLSTALRRNIQKVGRSQRRRCRHEDEARRAGVVRSTDLLLERAELQQRLVRFLLELPEAQRDVLLLRFFDQVPPRRIAEELAIPTATVRTRLQRGLKALRSRLEQEADGGDWRGALSLAFFPTGLPVWSSAAPAASTTSTAILMKISSTPPVATALLIALGLSISALLGAFGSGDGPDRAALRTQVRSASDSGDGDGSGIAAREAPRQRSSIPGRLPASFGKDARSPDEPADVPTEADGRARATGRLRGRVLDTDGRGIPGVLVHFASGSPPRWQDSVDDWIGDGSNSVLLDEERRLGWADRIRREEFLERQRDPADWRALLFGEATEGRSVRSGVDGVFNCALDQAAPEDGRARIADPRFEELVRSEDEEEGLVFVVARSVRLEGVVTDRRGRLVLGARVGVDLGSARYGALVGPDELAATTPSTRTDDRGRFVLRSVPLVGGAFVTAQHETLGRAEVALPPVDSTDLELRFGRVDDRLIGWRAIVRDPGGRPVVGAEVLCGGLRQRTSDEGRVDFSITRDQREVFVRKAGFAPLVVRRRDLASEDDVQEIQFGSLSRAIRGWLVDEDGRPVAGASVTGIDETFPGTGFTSIEGLTRGARFATSGADGAFELGGMLDRNYRLRAFLNEPDERRYVETEAFAAGDDSVRVVLPRIRFARRDLRIVDLDHRPLTGVEVHVGWTAVEPRRGWLGEMAPWTGQSDERGLVEDLRVPERFGFVEFRSEQIGSLRIEVADLASTVRIPRLVEVRLRVSNPDSVVWVVFRAGGQDLDVVVGRGGEAVLGSEGDETVVVRPTASRLPVCRVPQTCDELQWFDGAALRSTRVSIDASERSPVELELRR